MLRTSTLKKKQKQIGQAATEQTKFAIKKKEKSSNKLLLSKHNLRFFFSQVGQIATEQIRFAVFFLLQFHLFDAVMTLCVSSMHSWALIACTVSETMATSVSWMRTERPVVRTAGTAYYTITQAYSFTILAKVFKI